MIITQGTTGGYLGLFYFSLVNPEGCNAITGSIVTQ